MGEYINIKDGQVYCGESRWDIYFREDGIEDMEDIIPLDKALPILFQQVIELKERIEELEKEIEEA